MMLVIFARAPTADAKVWPGRHALALVDALAWPVACVALVLRLSVSSGLVGHCIIAGCAVSALARVYRAVVNNHRYHFTTWRWGRWTAILLGFGFALKVATRLNA
jgi:hypothetical protein